MSQPPDPTSALIGTWKLQALHVEFADNGEHYAQFGPAPHGRLILTGTGDFVTVITSAERASSDDAARLFETMMAYAGKYRIEGDRIIVRCDVAWHPDWVDTEQVRFFKLEGDRLSLRSPRQTHPRHPDRPVYGVIDWRRES
jgi:hypothetical protein